MPVTTLSDLSEGTQRCLRIANEEAIRQERNHVDTEHFLLGLLRRIDDISLQSIEVFFEGFRWDPHESGLIGVRVLHRLGLSAETVRRELHPFLKAANEGNSKQEISLTPQAKHALDLGLEEAQSFGEDKVDTQHLLLGLLSVEGVACKVLTNLGVTLEQVRREIRTLHADPNVYLIANPK